MVRPQDKTILIADDEPDIVVYLKTLLEDAGFNVMTAFDGDEALEKIRQHTPDLVSLDLVMPRKSGIRCYYELRRNKAWSKVKVIIVTAHARDEKVRSEMDELFSGATVSGARIYLEKPVHPEDYVNLVRRELGIEETAPDKAAPSAGYLKDEIKKLLDEADRETLADALKMLHERKTTKK